MLKRRRRVLIALGWYDYRVHRGIERFAQEHDWHLSTNFAREKIIPWGWEGQGILAWLGAGDDLAEFVSHAKKPTVDFSFRRTHLKFPRVLEDHTHAAQLVAEHFLSRGFRNFLFYSDADNWSYEERGQGFIAALRDAGHTCEWIRWHKSPAYRVDREQWTRKRSWLAAQMKRSAKPLAVFAANDDHALDVLESCQSADIAIPEQVAIAGAENSLLAPDAMLTPISSVDTNLEQLGYTGAALLEKLMNGGAPPEQPIRVPAAGLITRKSSDLLALNHKGVANSLRFIWEHCHEPISVKDLVGAAAMSRRGLHKAFLDNLGRTPGQELQRMRIERAKRLLSETDQKVEIVAGMCGFQSANSFCVAFKQATGASPRHFRNGSYPAQSRLAARKPKSS
ncbi:MAG: XylR family transcriptional regulator [Akkermansiaceae bacterium]|nr:XylR family transcriptional regulator [Verrucomicrobiales bacterium]